MEIYIWGTGCGAAEAIDQGLSLDRITAFIDSCPAGDTFLGLPVFKPDYLKSRHPDLIIVTCRYAIEIEQQCRFLGIPESKILYLKDHNIIEDRNTRCTTAAEILGDSLLSQLVPVQHLVTEPDSLRAPVIRSRNDYVRISTLELLARRISRVPGALAELGVYKGGFSSCMNQLMPERTLYLFDTFSGFDQAEGQRERDRSTCGDAFLAAHRNTAEGLVLKRMPHPESVTVKAGYFPQSLQGLEDRFALVSLDADFRDSTLEGLRYFWPRLNPGGYLMLHDWGSPKLTGVSEAVALYEQEIGYFLPAVPIPDMGNSLIITKVSIL